MSTRVRQTVFRLALLVLGSSGLSGCGHVREYNRLTPEMLLQRSVESVSSKRAVRLKLNTGETLEGLLVRRNWPQLILVTADSLRGVDGREVVEVWEKAHGCDAVILPIQTWEYKSDAVLQH